MKQSLLNNLLAFYEEDPTDPFNVYALALEYSKTDSVNATRFFDLLLTEHPEYLATYYHAAAFFAVQENFTRAEKLYKDGITLALNQNNLKTHQELVRAYRGFLDEFEE
jgi:hypothetical protein